MISKPRQIGTSENVNIDLICPRLVPKPRITQKDLFEVSQLIRDCKLLMMDFL